MDKNSENFTTNLDCLIKYCLETLFYIVIIVKLDLDNGWKEIKLNPILDHIFTAVIDKLYISAASIFAPEKPNDNYKHIWIKQLFAEYPDEFVIIKKDLEEYFKTNKGKVNEILENRNKTIAHWDISKHTKHQLIDWTPTHNVITYNEIFELVSWLLIIIQKINLSETSRHNIKEYIPVINKLIELKDWDIEYLKLRKNMWDDFVAILNK